MLERTRRAMRGLLAPLVAALVLAGGASIPAFAGDYPSGAVRLIVPSTPGGAIDVLARIIGPKLSIKWGQPVVIDNRAGAGGIIGTQLVAKSAPDGQTLLLVTTGLVSNPFLYASLPYRTPADFTPITIVGITPNVLVANPAANIHSVKEMIAFGKAHPGALNYGSSGIGSGGYLQMTLLSQLTGIEMTHVPYSGAGAAVTAVLANQTQLLSSSVSALAAHVNRKSLVPLAIMASKRSEVLPSVPTIGEAGLPEYSAEGWYGLLGPRGMKPELVDKLYKDVLDAIRSPDVVAQLKSAGFEPGGIRPDDFLKYLNTELATWQKVLAKVPSEALQK